MITKRGGVSPSLSRRAGRRPSLSLRRRLQPVGDVRVFLDPADVLGLPVEVASDVGLLGSRGAHFPDGSAEFQPCAVDDVFGSSFGTLDLCVRGIEGSHGVAHLSIITPLMWPP